jgi:hypothetical protein
MSAALAGSIANWPNEPAAPVSPTATLRFSGGKGTRYHAEHDAESGARKAHSDEQAGGEIEHQGRRRVRHRHEPQAVREAAEDEHAPGAEAIGDRARERHGETPHEFCSAMAKEKASRPQPRSIDIGRRNNPKLCRVPSASIRMIPPQARMTAGVRQAERPKARLLDLSGQCNATEGPRVLRGG